MDDPLGFFITFRTYGTWLHGDERGSTDRSHNAYDTPRLQPDPHWEEYEKEQLSAPPFVMKDRDRAVVESAITATCQYRGWHIWSLKVRTNHVHIVISSTKHTPERILVDLKAYATRALREAGSVSAEANIWARHGSTPHLYTTDQLHAAIRYVELMQD